MPAIAQADTDGALSLGGRRWDWRPADERMAAAIAEQAGVPALIGHLLSGRGETPASTAAYLSPTLRALMPDPDRLADLPAAVDRLARAIGAGERIAVFADYDVDGATAAALLIRFLRLVGAPDPVLHIPDRIIDGYGPNPAALGALKADGVDLAVLVDCGTTAFDSLEHARSVGLDVVVIDHHTPDAKRPPAVALVNPNRFDDTSGLGHLAACGVVFMTLVGLNRRLRKDGRYADRREPDLRALLDLVALGTVCDVVPLTGLNRAFVRQGLAVASGEPRAGWAALAERADVKPPFTPYHCGFVLGPRLNAGGRLGPSTLGTNLLSTDDPLVAMRLAVELDAFNDQRKAVEQSVTDAALEAAAARPDDAIAVVAGEGWHPGVIGIVAGRLRERLHKPVCVVSVADDVGKGSGRSVPGLDLGALIITAREQGLLIAGGGHAQAAGFTVAMDRLDDLRLFLSDGVARAGMAGTVPRLTLDAQVLPRSLNVDLVERIGQLGPFGNANPEPCLVLPRVRFCGARVVGNGHVQGRLEGEDGASLKAIAFRAAEGPLGRALLGPARDGRPLNVAGAASLDHWRGTTRVSFRVIDAAWS